MWQINFFIFATLISASLANKCGISKVTKSVNESVSAEGQWPWLASIFYDKGYYCSSSVISNKHLLSAAHCAHSKGQLKNPVDAYHAFLGRYDLNKENEENALRTEFSEIFVHPDWSADTNSFDADLAIFEMKSEVEFNSLIQPICLPSQGVDILDVDGTLSGYGVSIITETLVNLPKYLDIKAVDEKTCLYADPDLAQVGSRRMFCGGVKGKNPCRGDSGGPYMVKQGSLYTVYGLVSVATKDKCADNDFVLFTEVPHYLEWIKNITGLTNDSIAEIDEKEKAQLEEWSKKIQKGDYEEILKLAKDPEFFIRFSVIIKAAYANDLNNVENVLKFIRELPHVWQSSICYLILYNQMKANNHLESHQFNILVYGMKEMMERPEYETLYHVFKVQFEVITKEVPASIKDLASISGKDCTIKSAHFNEYFYVAASGYNYDSKRHRVFTWIPGTCDSSCHWSIETKDYGKTFKIKDQTKREYIYAVSGAQYDDSRRSVFAWSDENSCDDSRCHWRIVPKDGKFLIYSHGYGSEYLYAANIKYDSQRRYVFTWIPGGKPTGEGEWEIKCNQKEKESTTTTEAQKKLPTISSTSTTIDPLSYPCGTFMKFDPVNDPKAPELYGFYGGRSLKNNITDEFVGYGNGSSTTCWYKSGPCPVVTKGTPGCFITCSGATKNSFYLLKNQDLKWVSANTNTYKSVAGSLFTEDSHQFGYGRGFRDGYYRFGLIHKNGLWFRGPSKEINLTDFEILTCEKTT